MVKPQVETWGKASGVDLRSGARSSRRFAPMSGLIVVAWEGRSMLISIFPNP